MAQRNDGKGISLAKGPVLIIGLAMLAFGILALISGATGFTAKPLDGIVSGTKFLGLEVNGWSSLLFIAGGALLVFGSPLHWGAKSMSIIVGAALIAASILAFVNEDSALGIFAANGLTSSCGSPPARCCCCSRCSRAWARARARTPIAAAARNAASPRSASSSARAPDRTPARPRWAARPAARATDGRPAGAPLRGAGGPAGHRSAVYVCGWSKWACRLPPLRTRRRCSPRHATAFAGRASAVAAGAGERSSLQTATSPRTAVRTRKNPA